MRIEENRVLFFRSKKASAIQSFIPKATISQEFPDGKHEVAVYWGLDEWQVLRNLGVRVPHPILGRYKWPGVYTPFDHQKVTAAFLASNKRAYCLNQPGTGKTSSVAWASDYLMKQGRINRVLVICPMSIMDTAWRSDLFKTVMHRSVGIAHGSKAQRIKVIEQDPEYLIINFDGIKTVRDQIAAYKPDLIVIDEASQIKNSQSDRWKTIHSLVRADTWLWALTGTPAAQSPLDAFGLAKMTTPDTVPRFFGQWRDKTMVKINQFKWVPRIGAQDLVYEALQPAIQFTKEECLDLPDMLYTSREVELTPQQKKYYDVIRREMAVAVAGAQVTATTAATVLNKLLQVSGGSVFGDDKEVVEFDISSRYNELCSIIDGTPNKVLVFVPFRHAADRLQELLGKDYGVDAVDVIHGGVGATKRADIIKAFQTQDNLRILLLQPAAAAHGITLTRADQVVWWGPVTSTEVYLQANARAHRQGQKNNVTVTHLVGSPAERRIYTMLQDKIDLHTELLNLYSDIARGG